MGGDVSRVFRFCMLVFLGGGDMFLLGDFWGRMREFLSQRNIVELYLPYLL